MSGPPKMRSLAFAWLREEDWPRWLALDSTLEPNYQHWLTRMEKAFDHYTKHGLNVEKVTIEVDEFLEWSKANGGKLDSNARSTFAAYKNMLSDTDH